MSFAIKSQTLFESKQVFTTITYKGLPYKLHIIFLELSGLALHNKIQLYYNHRYGSIYHESEFFAFQNFRHSTGTVF